MIVYVVYHIETKQVMGAFSSAALAEKEMDRVIHLILSSFSGEKWTAEEVTSLREDYEVYPLELQTEEEVV